MGDTELRGTVYDNDEWFTTLVQGLVDTPWGLCLLVALIALVAGAVSWSIVGG